MVERVVGADDERLLHRLREIEARRRECDAETAVVLGELERRKLYRQDDHATMWGLLRASVGWSDRECRDRMRLSRLVAAFPDVGEILYDTQASVANMTEIARAHSNPRCGDEIEAELGALLGSACRNEFDVLRADVVRWEHSADKRAAHDAAESADDQRNAHFVNTPERAEFAAQWGAVDGLANREIFDQFVQAEWEADWAETVDRHGDDASPLLMPRTDAQRRADATTKIFERAASSPPGSKPPKPITVIHVDHDTALEALTEMGLLPERNADPFERPQPIITDRRCETRNGDPIDPITAIQVALAGHIRFAIADAAGIPTTWGGKRRLFAGPAREAALSLYHRCTHPGCRVRAGRSQADHTIEHSRGGPTTPDNGGPRCRRHNDAKNRGFTVWRDDAGDWHTYRPDGTEIP